MKKQIISMILVLCMVLSMMPVSVFAVTDDVVTQTATTESVTSNIESDTKSTDAEPLWEYTEVEGGVELTAYKGTATDIYVPSVIEVDGENLSVISLADGIFNNNDALNSVTLGKGILEIGDEAFYDCDNMVCILISEELTTIGEKAFYSCDNFNSVILYDTVESIGTDAFAQCPKLKVWCNDGTAGYAYATENNIPVEILNPEAEPEIIELDGITYYITNGEAVAVDSDDTLTEATVASVVAGCPVTGLNGTFADCSNLKTVNLPDSLKRIDSKSFYLCCVLESIDIPESVEYIGDSCFFRCSSLKSVEIPYGVTKLSSYSFFDCDSLSAVTVPHGVIYISDKCFAQCDSLTEFYMPDTVVSVSSYAFDKCINLTKVHLSENLTDVSSQAFSMCTSLTEITIPASVKTVYGDSFYGCTSLRKVVFEEGVEKILANAFTSCDSLTQAYIPRSATLYSNSFKLTTVLYVYENSIAHNVARGYGLIYVLRDSEDGDNFYQLNGVKYFIENSRAIAVGFDDSVEALELPDSINGFPVVEVRGAFANSKNLKSIVLPDSIRTISESSFAYCEALESVKLSDKMVSISKWTFRECKSLKTVILPGYLNFINEYAFYYCTSLKDIALPNSLYKISYYAFEGCSSITELNIPDSVSTIDYGAFSHCTGLVSVKLPKGTTTVSASVFSGCSSLQNVEIPYGVTTLDNSAFSSCVGLKSVSIPDSVKKIGNSTFGDCYNLQDVTLSKNLTSISDYAFDGCLSLGKINLPESVTTIGANAFFAGTALVVHKGSVAHSHAVSNDLIYIFADDDKDFLFYFDSVRYCLFNDKMIAVGCDTDVSVVSVASEVKNYPVTELRATFLNCENLESVTLPDSLQKIGNEAFKNCTSLKEVKLPDSVTSIGSNAFDNCINLCTVNIPENVTSIEAETFYGCTLLETIDLHCELESIGYYAFGYCTNLKEISLPDSLTEINEAAFYRCESLESVHIPSSVSMISKDAFRFCLKLAKVQLSYGNTAIKQGAFYGCKSLTELDLPSTINTIDGYTFASCESLRRINIPIGVTTINARTFDGCSALQFVGIPDTVTSLYPNAFERCPNLGLMLIPKSVTTMYVGTNPGSSAWGGFDSSLILLVYKGSYAHTFAKEKGYLYFILGETKNPEINYGTSLSGVVTYTDGSVASKATVEILSDDGTVKETVVADENGVYASTYAEVGDYIIRATDAQGNTATAQAYVKRMNIFEVFVTGDTNPVLKKSYSVSGAVSEGGAKVTITDEKGNIIDTVVADENGNFKIDDVPNDTYVVTAKGENGSVSQEITVFDADVSDLYLEIIPESVTIWGLVEVEDRKGEKTPRNWVDVTIYNSDGVVVDKCKTDSDGKYRFENLTLGEYSIVAEVFEMREDLNYGYDRNHKLTGYAYINITQTGEHQAGTIVLKEVKEELSAFEGKVTANGETQDCQVILRDSNRNEIAKLTTKKNGKFSFSNICDGVYYILAITKSDGMGYTVITVKDGEVYGDLHIRVYKSDKIQRREAEFEHDVPTCHSREDALKYKDRIADEKRFYDGLSEKEKKQLSEFYVERLNKLSEWITNVEYETPENVVVEQGGLVVSSNEIENEAEIAFNLNIEPVDSWQANKNGIETENDYIYHDVQAAANTQEIKQYYEITMTKTVDGEEKTITSVSKDTDAMGKFRITMPIPDEYKGYNHYSMVHVHNGETVVLTDLDDNPDTITVEVSEFSTFVLTATDTVYSSALDSLGDIDLDGEVTILDATRVQMYLAERTKLEEKQVVLADTTKDSVISIMDVTAIQMFIAQLIETL